MEKTKRARKRKPETSHVVPAAPCLRLSGGQGVHREVESEGHEEKSRAVINGGYPDDEPVSQRWRQVELELRKRRRFSFTPPLQGECGQHGKEEQRVTSG